jgi:3-methyl-2-oxobutanoate hydroxymethyltransferase
VSSSPVQEGQPEGHTNPARRFSVRELGEMKQRGERIPMLTAYDRPTATILDAAGIPAILVGDSVGDNVLGYDSTVPVTLDEMLHHTAAVVRGAPNAVVIADLPFGTYQVDVEDGLRAGIRLLKEAGATAIKAEGGGDVVDLARRSVAMGMPFMGHLGLTPQSVNHIGYRVQGRDETSARRLVDDAHALQEAGAFAIVLEAVPAALAREVTEGLAIPTIGIGAGPHTDGQILVLHDLLGLNSRPVPRFAKTYVDLRTAMLDAVKAFRSEVADGVFPADEHSF